MSTAGPDPDDGASRPHPLDGRWVLEVQGRIYGPYTGHALKEYARQGRVAPHSTVARTGRPAGEEEWVRAADDPVLGTLFEGAGPVATPVRSRMTRAADDDTSYGPAKGQVDRRTQPTSFNIVIVTDVKSRSSGPLETAILSLGPAFKVAANTWIVHTPSGAPEVVNLLTPHVGSADRLFVVDATRNRTAWFNMGPETDAKIRQVWHR